MRLEEKGPIQPVPVLAGPSQKAVEEILSWPAIISASHWDFYDPFRVDGADFYVSEAELGHIHLGGEVHLATTPELGVPLLQQRLASRFPYGGAYGNWVTFAIRTEADADHAIWLFPP